MKPADRINKSRDLVALATEWNFRPREDNSHIPADIQVRLMALAADVEALYE